MRAGEYEDDAPVDAVVFEDPAGAEWALLQVDRPGAMDGAYADPSNDARVL